MGDYINEQGLRIPNHVAIILDGNGRWAKKRLMPRNYGHKKGSENVEKVCKAAYDMGVKYLTMYAFSTENWKRPADEVEALMKLLNNQLIDSIERSNRNNMRVRIIGDKTKLSEEMQKNIADLEEATKINTGLNFQIALNYGSRDEIVRAVRDMVSDYDQHKLSKNDITEELFANYLDTKDIPDPDLLIRTSGEERLSNYLLWQLAYTEFYFTDTLWPDFGKEDLKKAVEKYNRRERRFGKL